jgi:hypothetical protein
VHQRCIGQGEINKSWARHLCIHKRITQLFTSFHGNCLGNVTRIFTDSFCQLQRYVGREVTKLFIRAGQFWPCLHAK